MSIKVFDPNMKIQPRKKHFSQKGKENYVRKFGTTHSETGSVDLFLHSEKAKFKRDKKRERFFYSTVTSNLELISFSSSDRTCVHNVGMFALFYSILCV